MQNRRRSPMGPITKRRSSMGDSQKVLWPVEAHTKAKSEDLRTMNSMLGRWATLQSLASHLRTSRTTSKRHVRIQTTWWRQRVSLVHRYRWLSNVTSMITAARWATEFCGIDEIKLPAKNGTAPSPWGNGVAIIGFIPYWIADAGCDERPVSIAASHRSSAEY